MMQNPQKFESPSEYDFINYEADTLYTPRGDSTLANFYEALFQLSQGKDKQVSIVHFGDSHLQADIFSGRVRERFHSDSLFGNAGRGFIYPAKIAGSHDAYNIGSKHYGYWQGCSNLHQYKNCGWGLGGYTAITNQVQANFSIWTVKYSEQEYWHNTVKVYYDTQDSTSFEADIVLENGDVALKNVYPYYAEFLLPRSQKDLKVVLKQTTPLQKSFTLKGVSLETVNPGILYHAVGVNGAAVPHFKNSPDLGGEIQSLKPDLVIISLGTNDGYVARFDTTQFRNDYQALIDSIRKYSPEVNILLTTAGDCYYQGSPSKFMPVIQGVMFDLADKNNCAVWDWYVIMGGLASMQQWVKNGLAGRDYLHYTKKGYFLQGDLFYDALMWGFEKYQESK